MKMQSRTGSKGVLDPLKIGSSSPNLGQGKVDELKDRSTLEENLEHKEPDDVDAGSIPEDVKVEELEHASKVFAKLWIPYRDLVAHEAEELTSFEVAQDNNELEDYVPEETMVSILVEK